MAKCGTCQDRCEQVFFDCDSCSHCYCVQCIYCQTGMTRLAACPEPNCTSTLVIKKVEPDPSQCAKHSKPVLSYCLDCMDFVCQECHKAKDHKIEFAPEAAAIAKKTLFQQLGSLKQEAIDLSIAVEEIRKTKSEIQYQEGSVKNDIKKSFEKMHAVIENRKQELLKENYLNVSQKLECLLKQENHLLTSYASVQRVTDITEQCLEKMTDVEIIRGHTEVQAQIRQVKELKKCLEPAEEADIVLEVNCVEDLDQFCKTKARIARIPIDAMKCTITGGGVISAEVNKMSEFSVTTKMSNAKPTRRSCTIECHLKSLARDSECPCQG